MLFLYLKCRLDACAVSQTVGAQHVLRRCHGAFHREFKKLMRMSRREYLRGYVVLDELLCVEAC